MSSTLLHVLILWGVIAVVLGVILTIHRKGRRFGRLPYAGIFGFVGAAFGVVVGMTTFSPNQHYANFGQAAEREATSVGQVAALSGAFSKPEGEAIRAQLYCYATDVIDREWKTTNDRGSPSVEGRERAVYVLLLRVGRDNPRPYNWYTSALSATLTAGEERQDRLLLSSNQIPAPLWILLYIGAGLIVVFAFFFHLEGRGQLLGMTVAVIVMLTAIVAVLAGLDLPSDGPLGLKPDAMSSVRAGLALDLPPAARDATGYCARLPVPPGEPAGLL